MNIDILNYNEIYKFFQTPRNYRKEINNLKFVFSYNFDKEIINISNLQINDQINQKVNVILNQLVSQENLLQNRIYFNIIKSKSITIQIVYKIQFDFLYLFSMYFFYLERFIKIIYILCFN